MGCGGGGSEGPNESVFSSVFNRSYALDPACEFIDKRTCPIDLTPLVKEDPGDGIFLSCKACDCQYDLLDDAKVLLQKARAYLVFKQRVVKEVKAELVCTHQEANAERFCERLKIELSRLEEILAAGKKANLM